METLIFDFVLTYLHVVKLSSHVPVEWSRRACRKALKIGLWWLLFVFWGGQL